jgi:hypothetical protein
VTVELQPGRDDAAAPVPPAGPAHGGSASPGRPGTGLAARVGRSPEWLVTLLVGAVTAVLGVIPQWRGTFFYFVGDQPEQFAPMWHLFGQQLRAGHWPVMDPNAWMGGNNAAEGLTGIWNPVNLLDYLLVSTLDNLSLASFVVMVQFLVLLSMGTYLLVREYGSARWAAVVVATALPFSGFTLWYEASGWPAGLMAFTWTAHFWWSARRFSRGRLNPVVPFLFGALTVTTGNPYGTLGILVVLAAIAVELLVARRARALVPLVVMGAAVGALALLVYLPLLGTTAVSDREGSDQILNDTFLVPGLGDLLSSSSPTYVPAITNWGNAAVERVPSTYFAWFLAPLLPWLRWRSLRGRALGISVFVVGGFYLLATVGPSNLWMFRWPIRLVEYFWLAVAVVVARLLSAGLRTDNPRRRIAITAGILLVDGYLAWAVLPTRLKHADLAALLLVGALVALLVWSWRRRGPRTAALVAVAGNACVLVLQTTALPAFPSATFQPHDLARVAQGTTEYRGTTLQLAQRTRVTTEQMATGQILFGNVPRAAGVQSVGTYTGMGFHEFAIALCMDYRGAVCPDAYNRVFGPTGPDVPAPLVDTMRVSTLVLQRSLLPQVADSTPPAGWHVVERNDVRTVWVRDRPLTGSGRVSWTSPGVDVLHDVSPGSGEEQVRYSADRAGRVVLARLAWPGYRATVDGAPVAVHDGPAGLLVVDVPAGTHSLELDFAEPGLRTGAVAAAVGILLALGHAVFWWISRRRRARAEALPQG